MKKFISYVILTLALSSVWFLISYTTQGEEFFNYFFIRENLGKFASQNYPVTSIIIGLFVFSLPHSLNFFNLNGIKKVYSASTKKSPFHDDLFVFLFFHFVVFFFLWFLPKQKSHHYAIPSLFFFQSLILYLFNKTKTGFSNTTHKVYLLFNFAGLVFICFLTILTFIFFSKKLIFLNLLLLIIVPILILIGSIFSYKGPNKYLASIFTSFLIISSLWCITAPIYFLPVIPNKVKVKIKRGPLAVIYRKPFFIEESIKRKFKVLDPSALNSYLKSQKGQIILRKEIYNNYAHDKKQLTIIESWDVWKRGNRLSKIIEAIKDNDLESLQEKMLLAELGPN